MLQRKVGKKTKNKQRTRNQCYKDFTGLYSQVCKHRPIFKVNYSPTCRQIQYVDARFHFQIPSSLTEKSDIVE